MKNKSIDYKIKNSLISVKPYIYTEPSISVISLRMLILLFVQILVLIFTKSNWFFNCWNFASKCFLPINYKKAALSLFNCSFARCFIWNVASRDFSYS